MNSIINLNTELIGMPQKGKIKINNDKAVNHQKNKFSKMKPIECGIKILFLCIISLSC